MCAAVSALTVNTVNSIETLTDDAMRVDEKPEGGYLKLELPDEVSEGTNLLMKSLVLDCRPLKRHTAHSF